jgi:hypothetical protein
MTKQLKKAIHLDLKGLPPTPKRFTELLHIFAEAGYNTILTEWEDSFPWQVDKDFRSPSAYSRKEIQKFIKTADQLNLEVIPLVQCLGHMQTPLSLSKYAYLREVPDNSSELRALAPGARELIEAMIDDVLEVMPNIKHFHLGGDEAGNMGTHPDTKAYIEKYGKDKLYLMHINPLLDKLNSKGITPILWHDMMINWSDKALSDLAEKSNLMVWGYNGNPDTTNKHFNTKYIKRFAEQGINLWAATAYKGAGGHNSDWPFISKRIENATAWSDIAARFNFKGIVATGWSRFNTGMLQCQPIDAALDSAVIISLILNNKPLPENKEEFCNDFLEKLGQKQCFTSCRNAMEALANVRKDGWTVIQALKEQTVLDTINPKRSLAKNTQQFMNQLNNAMKRASKISDEVRKSFAGLIAPVWIEEYLDTRLRPLQEEMDRIKGKARL